MNQPAREACERLRDHLLATVGDDLVALWAYGAATFPDPPRRLGDVDTHGILAHPPGPATATRIDAAHGAIAGDLGIEWDSWYVLATDAGRSEAPRHAFRPDAIDHAWALHRAHWLSGQYVVLHGADARAIVPEPAWAELEEALDDELEYIDGLIAAGEDDAYHAAFSIWNGCRICYSLQTQDVVVSKRAAAAWALEHLPARWHDAIIAAGRSYDDELRPGDEDLLRRDIAPFVVYVRTISARAASRGVPRE